MVKVQFLFGHQVMVVGIMTTVTVMVIRIQFIVCQYRAQLNMDMCLGIVKHVVLR